MKDMQIDEQKLENIPIMHEFSDLFSNDLLGLPPNRKIKFSIDLVPDIGPISKALYQMALAELKKLKEQL